MFGKHFVKAGVLLSINKKNEEPANTTPGVGAGQRRLPASWDPNGYLPNGVTTRNAIAQLAARGHGLEHGEIRTNKPVLQRWKDYEGYIADTYKVSPRVTADVGVRFSHFTQPFMADDQMATFDPSTVEPGVRQLPLQRHAVRPPGTNPCPALGLPAGRRPEPLAAAHQGRPGRATARHRLGRVRQR